MNILYEILVPTEYGDTRKPISTRHHREWDKKVIAITGGITILPPGRGKWEHRGEKYHERVIPVRIMCKENDLMDIIHMTIRHYRQKAVMFFEVSRECFIIHDPGDYDDGASDRIKTA